MVARVMILAPLQVQRRPPTGQRTGFACCKKDIPGFIPAARYYLSKIYLAADAADITGQVFILVDRAVMRPRRRRFTIPDFRFGANGFFRRPRRMPVHFGDENRVFSDKFELDGMVFEEPIVNFFSFNNPYGACQRCEGFGTVLGIDEDLVIPDKSLSVYEGAIAPWRTEKQSEWQKPLIKNGIRFDFPIHRPYNELTEEQQQLLWTGNKYFDGLDAFFEHIQAQTHKIQYRVMLSRYRGRTTCPDCRGTRLRKDAIYVKINGQSITDLFLKPVTGVLEFFQNLQLDRARNCK